MKKILSTPYAFPFFIAVFLNAFVDLGHKIVIQNTVFKIYDGSEQVILTAILNGLILLPVILLFSPAGLVSDRYPKHRVMQYTSWVAVILTSLITLCYALGWFWAAFAMTFLLAVQSAFYFPAKYAYLKYFFGKQRLAEANGAVQAVVIIAILLGTFVFSILFEMLFPANVVDKNQILQTIMPVGFLLIANSIFELIMVYRLPNVDSDKTLITHQPMTISHMMNGNNLKTYLSSVWSIQSIRLSMIGLAMFWSVGQVMLAVFPAFAKASLGELNTVVIQGIMAATGIGIALGAVIAGRLSKNYIETGLIPLGALGIAIGLFLLPTLTTAYTLAINFLFIGMMGSLFIVPLNALIQFYASEQELGKTLSVTNLTQNAAMLSFLILTVVFSALGVTSQQLLNGIAVVGLLGGIYTVVKLPQSLVRFILTFLMSRHYKVAVQGMKNIPESGGILLLGNHISFVDWAMIQIACPRQVHFVMHKKIYETWYLNWFLRLFGCIPIESGASSKQSLEAVAELLNRGKVVCLFPEGLLSRTGHLAEFRKGYEQAAQLANDSTQIIPFYLHGLWGSQFSRSSEHLKQTRSEFWGREVIVAFGQPTAKNTSADKLKRIIFDLSIISWQEYTQGFSSIPAMWIDSVKRRQSRISDATGTTMSSSKALAAASAFSVRMSNQCQSQNIGLLLPSSSAGIIANMAGLMAGKTLVNLNYTASIDDLLASIQQADIKTVYTSKRFIDKLLHRGIDLSAALEKVSVVYLEDVQETISQMELLKRWLMTKLLTAKLLKALWVKEQAINSTAAILFSSGSEGLPKGVQLSHQNILANVKQVADVLNTQRHDTVMASLPLFHAFGLTVTQFMPLIEGLPVVCHPDPTDVTAIAKAIAKHQATIMLGTSTFLRLYISNKKVHPLMLKSLRLVVAGAEKLNPSVREAFSNKFNKDIYEGYGTTETSPVASVNIPDAIDLSNYKVQKGSQLGSVGMPLPGSSFKIVDPETMEELPTGSDGMILVGGVQVMQGYLNNPEKTQQFIKLIDGFRWYITGDKGHLDENGYLTIIDRYSRFAKLGGEMVSLAAVEQSIRKLLNVEQSNDDVLAINLPDSKKGERIVLLSTLKCKLDQLRLAMLDNQCNPLMIPSDIIVVEAIPLLGSGKTDFSKAKQLAKSQLDVQEVIN